MDKAITYDYLWENIFKKSIDRIWNEIPIDEKELFCVTKKEDSFIKEQLYNEYTRKKERLKTLYHYDDGDPERRIDIHKIASCFAQVLMEHKIFHFECKEGLSDAVFFMNAKLAYEVSIGMIYLNLVYYYLKENMYNIVNELLEKRCLEFPETTAGHDEYSVGRYKTLALNDVFGNDFDVLTYSDMMFWIEFYNRQILENTVKLFRHVDPVKLY